MQKSKSQIKNQKWISARSAALRAGSGWLVGMTQNRHFAVVNGYKNSTL